MWQREMRFFFIFLLSIFIMFTLIQSLIKLHYKYFPSILFLKRCCYICLGRNKFEQATSEILVGDNSGNTYDMEHTKQERIRTACYAVWEMHRDLQTTVCRKDRLTNDNVTVAHRECLHLSI